MNKNELLNRLLGIQKLQVIKSEFIGEDKLHLEVVSTLSVASCPDCGQVSEQVHDESEAQMIRDLSIAERQCYLVYRARRFKCEQCKKTFVERVEWKRANVSYTERYERYLYQRVRRESVSQVAQDEGLSEETVQAIFEYRAKKKRRRAGTRKGERSVLMRFRSIVDTASLCWSSRLPN
ncbi:MAG TPA: transposase family protein [Anaerolineales bacterium]|nr:transposase family protein [Anaerolineales bacterium]